MEKVLYVNGGDKEEETSASELQRSSVIVFEKIKLKQTGGEEKLKQKSARARGRERARTRETEKQEKGKSLCWVSARGRHECGSQKRCLSDYSSSFLPGSDPVFGAASLKCHLPLD